MSSADNLCKQFGLQNVGLELDPNCLLLMLFFLKYFSETVDFEIKSAADRKIMQNYLACKELNRDCRCFVSESVSQAK